jgi:hypothetical protein
VSTALRSRIGRVSALRDISHDSPLDRSRIPERPLLLGMLEAAAIPPGYTETSRRGPVSCHGSKAREGAQQQRRPCP